MSRSVPLARRNLLSEPRRLAAAAGGVGMALMLILLLDGLWAGIKANVTTYEDNVGADLYVAQTGTKNFFGAVSVLPTGTVDTVRADPDVDWGAAVRGFFSITQLHDRKVPTYVIGSTPGERGGPWDLRTGRAAEADNEVTIGSVLANQHGLAVGDDLDIMGRSFRIVGTTTDAFMASFVFMTHDATDQLLRAPGTTSFVLVGTTEPAAVRSRLEAAGLNVLDRDELARNDLALMARAYEVPLGVMRAVALAIGSLVIALTTYSAVVDRRREYGIVKAIGASGGHLVGLAIRQTMLVSSVGLVTGGLLFVVGRAYINAVRPQFVILATPGNIGRAVAAAVLMGLVAAILPARRLAKLEPATAYQGG